MPAVFTNTKTSGVGTAETTLYVVAAGKKAILIGCNVANTTKAILPVTLSVRTGASLVSIVTNKRVANGTNDELMRGNKMVLLAGDAIVAVAGDDTAFDIILSLLEGVT